MRMGHVDWLPSDPPPPQTTAFYETRNNWKARPCGMLSFTFCRPRSRLGEPHHFLCSALSDATSALTSCCTVTVCNLKVLSGLPLLHQQNSNGPSYSTPFSSATALVSGPIASYVSYTITPITAQRVASFFYKNSFALPVGYRSILCDQVRLHLVVWNWNSFVVRPIPKCLLHHNFFEEYITPRSDLQVHTISTGFLSTYLQ